jgi:D-alanyl-D-alanine carboxypeptidase (penicillin-binding protein 5/6)
MAEVISGSEEKFVDLMNKKAKELGLKNTSFKNSTGLDENNHYSTAKDLSLIAQELINKHPEILKFSSLYEDYLREDTPNKFWLVNTNKLIRFYDGADGLKTGHTDNAHYCLAATTKRDNLRLIAIVLGEENSKIRNSEAMSLLDYGFSNINFNLLKEKGTLIKEIKLDKATKDTIPIILKADLGVVELIDNNTHKYHYDIKLDNLKLPIKKNSIVGKIKVIENNNIVSIGDLIVEEDIERLKYIELLINNLKDIVTGNL